MRRRILCYALASLPLSFLQSQTRPSIDYHQHLFSPAAANLLSAKPAPPVELPPVLDSLLQARSQSAGDTSALRDLYVEDAWLLQSTGPNWIRGRNAVVSWWVRSYRRPFLFTATSWALDGAAGYVIAYLTEGLPDSARHVAHILLFVRRAADGRWRIGAESFVASGSPSVNAITAKDLIVLLDAAGIRRALVLSMGYTWGSANRTVENEYEKVKAENDWTSQQVALFPDRLRAFCSFNPLKPYALDELARCAKDARLRFGLKLHFGNSDVDLDNTENVEQLKKVFRAANDYRMPIVVHMRTSISKRRRYGQDQAQVFLNQVLPEAPDIPVQIAHLAGAGGYDDPTTDEALKVFVDAIARNDLRTKHLYFDVTSVVLMDISSEKARVVASRIRQLGLGRVLYGSDAAAGGNLAPRQGWAAFRQLPLTDAEFQTIADNVAPYMR